MFKKYLFWIKTRKTRLYDQPDKVFERQNKALQAISGMEGYRMIKDFIFSEYERSIEEIEQTENGATVEKQKGKIEFCKKFLSYLEIREKD